MELSVNLLQTPKLLQWTGIELAVGGVVLINWR